MNIKDILFLSLNSLRSNTLRSFLSSLGVFMGVFAVSGTLEASDVGKLYLKAQLEKMGAPQIFIFPPYSIIPFKYKKFQSEDLAWLKANLSGWRFITPRQNGGTDTIFFKKQQIPVQSKAVTPDFLMVSGKKLIKGDFFSVNDFQQSNPVVIIDQLTAQKLFNDSNPLGKMIYFQNKSYYIKGVIQTQQNDSESDGNEPTGLIIIPLTVYQSLKSNTLFSNIIITPKNSENVEEVKKQAIALLKKRFLHFNINAYSNIEEIRSQETQLNTVTIILLLIAGIALLVGGVGIANITIASIVERTSEIGLRRAIGATQNDILIQFLLEAILISMTGGIIAILTVQGITILTVSKLKFPYEFSYQTCVVSLGSAIIVGIASSFLPALRASNLDPVEALRSR